MLIRCATDMIEKCTPSRNQGIGVLQKCAKFQVSTIKNVGLSSNVQVPMGALTQQPRLYMTGFTVVQHQIVLPRAQGAWLNWSALVVIVP